MGFERRWWWWKFGVPNSGGGYGSGEVKVVVVAYGFGEVKVVVVDMVLER